jgi:hypothetical protein
MCACASAIRKVKGSIFGICLLLLAPAFAGGGREFSAAYDVARVSGDSERLSVRISLELRNESGVVLRQAEILLLDLARPAAKPQAFPIADLADRAFLTFSGTVSVNANQFERWAKGERPAIVLHFTNIDGVWLTVPIDLVRRPGLGATT